MKKETLKEINKNIMIYAESMSIKEDFTELKSKVDKFFFNLETNLDIKNSGMSSIEIYIIAKMFVDDYINSKDPSNKINKEDVIGENHERTVIPSIKIGEYHSIPVYWLRMISNPTSTVKTIFDRFSEKIINLGDDSGYRCVININNNYCIDIRSEKKSMFYDSLNQNLSMLYETYASKDLPETCINIFVGDREKTLSEYLSVKYEQSECGLYSTYDKSVFALSMMYNDHSIDKLIDILEKNFLETQMFIDSSSRKENPEEILGSLKECILSTKHLIDDKERNTLNDVPENYNDNKNVCFLKVDLASYLQLIDESVGKTNLLPFRFKIKLDDGNYVYISCKKTITLSGSSDGCFKLFR